MLYIKTIIAILLGLTLSLTIGFCMLPFLKSKNIKQNVSQLINMRHSAKSGTPTMGGLFFVFATLFVMFFLVIFEYIKFNFNLIIILFVFSSYAVLGFIDDYLKIKKKNNGGLTILSKFFLQVIITIVFFFFFILNGNNTIIDFFFFKLDLKSIYGIFILFYLIGFSNAVNITDGLDGLAAGLSIIVLIFLGILSFKSNFILGYEEIGLFCFTLIGSLIGFLIFNFYPAKIFMGDLGSLALGAVMASIAIILKQEIAFIFVGFIFIFEMLSSLIQIIAIRYFNKKVFLKSPYHHHLEEKGWNEIEIVKISYLIQLIIILLCIFYYSV